MNIFNESKTELEIQLMTVNETIDTFKTTGWAHLKTTIEQEITDETKVLLSCPLEEVEKHRGKIRGLRFILELEESQETERSRLTDSVALHQDA